MTRYLLSDRDEGAYKCRSFSLAISSYSNYSLIKYPRGLVSSPGHEPTSRSQRTSILRTFLFLNPITAEKPTFSFTFIIAIMLSTSVSTKICIASMIFSLTTCRCGLAGWKLKGDLLNDIFSLVDYLLYRVVQQ